MIKEGRDKHINKLPASSSLYEIQKIALCGTAHFFRRVLLMWLKNITQEATSEPDKKKIYYKLINISSRRAKRDEKCNYGVDWQQKGIQYSPAKLDNRLYQNV